MWNDNCWGEQSTDLRCVPVPLFSTTDHT